jgi:outer membrane receptor for ferrienterochelin and colicins
MKPRLIQKPLSIITTAIVLANTTFAQAAQTQEDIFVSAKAPISAQEFSGSVSVVTAKEIKASGATNIAQALEGVPGVSIGTTGNNGGEEIRIRGMSAEYGLILIDGKRVPNTERNIPFSIATRNRWVAIENIERIEVIRGAASSLYGADALSGVINIITKKATKEWQSNVTVDARGAKASGGDGSGINIGTRGALSESVAMKFSVDHQDDEAIEDDAGLSIRSKRRVTNTQLGFAVDVNADSQLNVDMLYGEETGVDSDALTDRSGNVLPGQSVSELRQIKQLFSADYSTKIADFNTKFSASKGSTTVKQGTNDWEVNDNTIAIDIDGAITEGQYISTGLSYREEKADRYDKNFSDKFKSVNGFVQDIIDINDSHALTLGFSFEDHNKYGAKVSPKLYWNWSMNEQWTMKVGYSEGRITPAIREGSSKYIISAGPTRTYQGNDDLNPEESKTLELSAAYSTEDITASVGVFHSKIDDLISIEDIVTGSHTLALYSNVDKAQISGLESSIAWQVTDNSKVSFNYTYLDTENKSGTNEGMEIAKRPKHTANLKLSQYVPAIDSNFSLAFKGVSKQYTNAANTNTIRGHGVVNVGFVKPLTKNIDLSASIKNIGDKRVLDGSEAIEVGREYRISLTTRF